MLSPVVYSYTTTMLQPSSLPLGVRSVEWLESPSRQLARRRGRARLLQLEGPEEGRAAAEEPAGGRPGAGRRHAGSRRARAPRRGLAAPDQAGVRRRRCPARGSGSRPGRSVDGRPPVLVTTFRSERRLSAHRRLRRLVRPHADGARLLSRPLRAAQRARARADDRSRTASAGGCWPPSTAASSTTTATTARRSTAVTYEPLKDGLATLIGYRDGRVDIKTWSGGPNAGPAVAFARQSLPLIVQNGRLNPALNDSSQWGYTLGNAVRVWRTGVGIDRRGNLIYAAADNQTVITLARILQRAGAVRAMQLDINPEWPTLITYSHHHGLDPTKVVPNVQQPATRYLVPDDRDFFAVYRRLPGPVTVPFK